MLKNGSFYHSGKALSAKIAYKIQIKITEKSKSSDPEDEGKVYKDELYVKINNHCKYVTIKRLLHSESTVTKFLCFGGGRTSMQCEF